MYEQIKTKENYDKLLASGMFWEFHPELSGDWNKDKILILDIDTKQEDNKLFTFVYVTEYELFKYNQQYHPAFSCVKYNDEDDILFIDLHY